MLVVSILTIAGYFQLFAEPYVMTQGGPVESTTSIIYMMVDQGFKFWNLGFATAIAVVLFAILFSLTLAQLALARWWSRPRSEEHTSELQSLMRISYAVFCLKKHNN